VELKQEDIPELEALVNRGKTEQRVARRARTLLAMHQGKRVKETSERVEQDPATTWRLCRRYEVRGLQAAYDAPRSGRPPGITALERVQIENLACSQPGAQGLALTHWSVRSLQTVVIRSAIIPTIHYTTIADILRTATLQPHRWRYWKTTVWDTAAIRQAAKILWCYERAAWLLERGILVACLDEKPNMQVLERNKSIRLRLPGQLEQHEFEYTRHGTVNFLVGLTVSTGQMWSECLEANDGDHFRPAVLRYLDSLKEYTGIYLIMDNGSSHIAKDTVKLLQGLNSPWVRPCYTPPHASWLNQAELLLRAFSERYFIRGTWHSRQEMIDHIQASGGEYNDLFAHPFRWSWTRSHFHHWVENKREPISCTTSTTVH